MRTLNRAMIRAPLHRVFAVAADVERWPAFLAHYRWVRILARDAACCTIEMAAWRPFGLVHYPTWWVSEMRVVPERAVRYRHVRGLTRGMDVEWRFTPLDDGVEVTIVHVWTGPRWPLVGHLAANWVIGPVFIYAIAARTLAGVKREAEAA